MGIELAMSEGGVLGGFLSFENVLAPKILFSSILAVYCQLVPWLLTFKHIRYVESGSKWTVQAESGEILQSQNGRSVQSKKTDVNACWPTNVSLSDLHRWNPSRENTYNFLTSASFD